MTRRKTNPDSLTVTVQECARMLGISVPYCYECLEAGLLPCRRLGAKYIISRHQIERWIENVEDVPPVEAKLVALPRK